MNTSTFPRQTRSYIYIFFKAFYLKCEELKWWHSKWLPVGKLETQFYSCRNKSIHLNPFHSFLLSSREPLLYFRDLWITSFWEKYTVFYIHLGDSISFIDWLIVIFMIVPFYFWSCDVYIPYRRCPLTSYLMSYPLNFLNKFPDFSLLFLWQN